jgi:CheY-like chemotaxis protein/anti-sigma regulatory factor (Ser/Thr protein kinase)
LAEVARDIVETTAPRWRDHAARHGRIIDARVLARSAVWTMGAVTELREAVTNLVLNAVDALPSGGSIDIEALEVGDRAVLRVSDTGTGMTEEVKQRIFDPFFTTKPFGQGTGLGLALVYGIVERHQGEIRVVSQPGEGTTFEIDLPLAPAASPTPELEEKQLDPTTQGLRILVVEDEKVLGEQLRTILSMDGHTIRLCSSGQEALDALYERYDLVITDLAMPGIGGKEVASAAKARFPDMPVGVVSGWTSDLVEVGDLAESGIDFVVPKPYRIQTIREAVAKACATPVLSS